MTEISQTITNICTNVDFTVDAAWETSTGDFGRFGSGGAQPSASLIKVPIALAAVNEIQQGRLAADEPLSDSQLPACGGTGVLEDLHLSPATLTPRRLIYLMLAASDNGATNILLSALGFDAIRRWCLENGLLSTGLYRRMMDVESIDRGIDNVTTAADITRCLMLVYYPLTDEENLTTDIVFRALLRQQHRNGLANGDFSNTPIRIANKTGSYSEAEHDAALFVSDRDGVAISVMTRGASCKGSALQLMNRIGAAIVSHLESGTSF